MFLFISHVFFKDIYMALIAFFCITATVTIPFMVVLQVPFGFFLQLLHKRTFGD